MVETTTSYFPYLPHTPADRQAMLKTIGIRAFEELIQHIPQEVRAQELKLPSGMSELELSQHIASLADKNQPAGQQASFLGGGSYRRFVPAVVPAIISRSEFATAYTPYQPEVSQGSLQTIYEFQTAVCLLTGMDVANASMYDGPTACAEAALMSARLTGRSGMVIADSVNPEYRLVTATYAKDCHLSLKTLKTKEGVLDPSSLTTGADVAALIVQYPNFFGCLEDLRSLGQIVHKEGAQLIVITDPVSLGLLSPPSEFGADIVVGDAQACGNYLSFGGPSAGYMATRKDFVRQLPGRLSGMTVDNRGQRAFTLTLQTREQHIRRAHASSNICTNQALNALAMLVYLTVMGPQGLKQTSEISLQRAHYLADRLCSIPGVKLLYSQPFFNEFAISLKLPAQEVLANLLKLGVIGGIDLGRFYPPLNQSILIAVTETNSIAQLDKYATALASVLGQAESLQPALITTPGAKT